MKISAVILIVLVAMLAGPAVAQTQGSHSPTGSQYTTGSIYVDTTPPDATALLDGGSAYLYTPGTFSAISPGNHNVIIAKPGYQSLSKDVKVTAGGTVNIIVTLDLVVAPGSLSISTTPKGAGVYVDGISQGKTDRIVGNLAPGPHLVTVELAGFTTWSEMVTVKSGTLTPVTATLVSEVNPTTGDLRVSSIPSGSAVYVNGNFVGTTPPDSPLDVTDLAPGNTAIVVKKSGYADYQTTAVIEAGRLVQVSATLQPAPTQPLAATAEITSSPGGANVYIDNVFVGITPLTFSNVTPGTYTILIRLNGYTPYSSTGQIAAGQNLVIAASLAPVATATPSTATTTTAPLSPFTAVVATIGCGIVVRRIMRRK